MKKIVAFAIIAAASIGYAQPVDLRTTIDPIFGLAPVVVSNNTAQTTKAIDLANYPGCEFHIITGVLADSNATFAVTLAHADSITDPTGALVSSSAVSSDSLIGTTASASFDYSADNTVKKIGYIKQKRYVQLTITPSGNTGSAPLAVIAVGRPYIRKGS